MTRIIEHRQDADPGENVFELRVFKLREGDVRACVVPIGVTVDHAMMEEMSAPVAEAFLAAFRLCKKDKIEALWVHDALGLFLPCDRPVPLK